MLRIISGFENINYENHQDYVFTSNGLPQIWEFGIIFKNEVANAVLCYNAITYLKIVSYLSRSILGLGDTESHTGNYMYDLQEKEKYHKTCKP